MGVTVTEAAPNRPDISISGPAPPLELVQLVDAFIVNRCLCAVAKLGVADALAGGPKGTAEIAGQIHVNESALYRVLRALASQGIFEETDRKTFRNNRLSHYLRGDVPGSMRPQFLFGGSEFVYLPYAELVYSIETGQPASAKVHGVESFEYLKKHPDQARIFDDAMTAMSAATGPAVAAAYDFGKWGSVMDVGGGNGRLLASILKAHPGLRGVLADQPHVLERARERGYLSGDLQSRVKMLKCDFLRDIPSGCRAYIMKSVIHDWEDEKARQILANCRRAVPGDGALLLIEWELGECNRPAPGKLIDVAMLVITGGRERTMDEYRDLLASAGFRLNQITPIPTGMMVMQALTAH
jgi:hypothetical protein